MKKIVIRLIGGTGNQLFQFAFAYYVKRKFNVDVFLDIGWFKNQDMEKSEYTPYRNFVLGAFPNVNRNIFVENCKNKLVYTEDRSLNNCCYIDHILTSKKIEKILFKNGCNYFDGYWQNAMFVFPYINEIRQLLQFDLLIAKSSKLQKIMEPIKNMNSVALHVRRGDFVKFDWDTKLDWFTKAIQCFKNKIENPHFFIFSDDIIWCKEKFKGDIFSFVDGNDELEDLYLMTMCKHNIVPNSTFSFWGSLLGTYENKIVLLTTNRFNMDNKNVVKFKNIVFEKIN